MAQASVGGLLDSCQLALAKMILMSINSNKPQDAADQTLGEKRAKRFQAEARAVALVRAAGPVPPPPADEADAETAETGEADEVLPNKDAINDNEGATVKDGHGFDIDRATLAEVQAETGRRLARFRRELETRGVAGDADRVDEETGAAELLAAAGGGGAASVADG